MDSDSHRLRDAVVVITGGGSGVGRAIALGCAGEGARVAILGRRVEALEETARLAGSAPILPIRTDVADYESVTAAARRVEQELGVPRVLVAAAGVHGEFSPILESDPAAWQRTLRINVVGLYHTIRAFAPAMVRRGGWGRIVNVSSASSIATPGGVNSAYPLSKVAVNHFTRQLAAELAETGVTANAMHPGEVKTEMWAAIRDDAVRHGQRGGQDWARLVEETGGDPPEKSAELVIELCDPAKDELSGDFLWIRDGIQTPRKAW